MSVKGNLKKVGVPDQTYTSIFVIELSEELRGKGTIVDKYLAGKIPIPGGLKEGVEELQERVKPILNNEGKLDRSKYFFRHEPDAIFVTSKKKETRLDFYNKVQEISQNYRREQAPISEPLGGAEQLLEEILEEASSAGEPQPSGDGLEPEQPAQTGAPTPARTSAEFFQRILETKMDIYEQRLKSIAEAEEPISEEHYSSLVSQSLDLGEWADAVNAQFPEGEGPITRDVPTPDNYRIEVELEPSDLEKLTTMLENVPGELRLTLETVQSEISLIGESAGKFKNYLSGVKEETDQRYGEWTETLTTYEESLERIAPALRALRTLQTDITRDRRTEIEKAKRELDRSVEEQTRRLKIQVDKLMQKGVEAEAKYREVQQLTDPAEVERKYKKIVQEKIDPKIAECKAWKEKMNEVFTYEFLPAYNNIPLRTSKALEQRFGDLRVEIEQVRSNLLEGISEGTVLYNRMVKEKELGETFIRELPEKVRREYNAAAEQITSELERLREQAAGIDTMRINTKLGQHDEQFMRIGRKQRNLEREVAPLLQNH